jgi:hypothetical protein
MQQQLDALIRLSRVTKAHRAIVARVTLSALEGAVHGASRSRDLTSPEFARELTQLVFAYLTSAAGGTATRHARRVREAAGTKKPAVSRP